MKVTSKFGALAIAAAGLAGVLAPPTTVVVEGIKKFWNTGLGVNAQIAGAESKPQMTELPAAKPLPVKASKLQEYKQ